MGGRVCHCDHAGGCRCPVGTDSPSTPGTGQGKDAAGSTNQSERVSRGPPGGGRRRGVSCCGLLRPRTSVCPPHARTHTHAHVHSMRTHVPHTHMHTHTHAHMHTLRLRTARDFLEVGRTGVAEGAWHR